MERMDLFNRKGESSEALFGNNDKSSDALFKYKQSKIPITNDVLRTSAANNYNAILSDDNKLYFSVGDIKYIVDLTSEDARNSCMHKLNQDTGRDFNWFKEETGMCNWVLYDSKMYVIESDSAGILYLHYIEDCGLNPIIPINASSCYKMFSDYKILSELDFSSFSTVNIMLMDYMFADSIYFEHLDLNHFSTVNLRAMSYMFSGCTYLQEIDLSSFNTEKIDFMEGVFYRCENLKKINLTNFKMYNVKSTAKMFAHCCSLEQIIFDHIDGYNLLDMTWMFFRCANLKELIVNWYEAPNLIYGRTGLFCGCKALPGFSPDHTGIEMAKSVEDDGYFITSKMRDLI